MQGGSAIVMKKGLLTHIRHQRSGGVTGILGNCGRREGDAQLHFTIQY